VRMLRREDESTPEEVGRSCTYTMRSTQYTGLHRIGAVVLCSSIQASCTSENMRTRYWITTLAYRDQSQACLHAQA
jgi:hypothetical protein